MKKIALGMIIFIFAAIPKLARSCGWDNWDGGWHGDSKKSWHGEDYMGCPRMHQNLPSQYSQLEGARVFESKGCLSCHTIGGGDKVGPDLKGLFDRRSEKWVKDFIKNPNKFMKKDEKAADLQSRYGSTMPDIDLSKNELNQIVIFLKEATK